MRADLFEGVRDRYGIQRVSEFYAASDGTAFTSFDWFGGQEGIGAVGHRGWLLEKMGVGSIIVKYDPIEETLVRDANGLCIECKRGEIGEIIGPYDPSLPGAPFYWNNKEAIEKKIYRDVKVKGDMWWVLFSGWDGFRELTYEWFCVGGGRAIFRFRTRPGIITSRIGGVRSRVWATSTPRLTRHSPSKYRRHLPLERRKCQHI
jgi:hypothetical protein